MCRVLQVRDGSSRSNWWNGNGNATTFTKVHRNRRPITYLPELTVLKLLTETASVNKRAGMRQSAACDLKKPRVDVQYCHRDHNIGIWLDSHGGEV
jgi:hypothetical protein